MSKSLPINENRKLVVISEAAKILGVSIDTIRRWDKTGILHSTRPNGKNRYFSVEELEEIKFSQSLPISEASKRLGISETTLRRLDTKGILKAKRNKNKERVYDREALDKFLNSDYFLRKKEIEDEILKPLVSLPENKKKESRFQTRQKIIGALVQDNTEKIIHLWNFRKAFLLSTLLPITIFIFLVAIITILFLLFPLQTAKWFGYRKPENLISYVNSIDRGQVLGAQTSQGNEITGQVLGVMLRPVSAVSLEVVKVVNKNTYDEITAEQKIKNVNDILKINSNGEIVVEKQLMLPDSSYLKIPDQKVVVNLNSELVDGKKPGSGEGDLTVWGVGGSIPGLIINSSDLVDGAVTTEKLAANAVTTGKIADGAITSAKFVSGLTFTPSDNSVTSAKIVDGTIVDIDISSSASISDSKLAQITSSNKVAGSAIQLSSTGGLVNNSGLSLKTTCTTSQVLVWDGSTWACGTGGGSGTITAVVAGSGLTGGGTSGSVTLAVSGLTVSHFASANISQWTNNSEYLTLLTFPYNSTNLTINGSNKLDTIQGISTAATPTFAGLYVTGNMGIGTTTPFSPLHISGGNTGGRSVAIFDQTGASSNDILSASASGATKMTLNNGGDLTLSGNVSIATGKTYSISGSTSQTYASAVCVTTTGGIVTGTGACTGGSTTDYWTLANGTLYPVNTTLDVLIGGTATSGANFAKFAFTGVNGSNTPTASISAGTAGGVYLTSTGILATTARQTLTLGDSTTTGNVIFNQAGNVGIGTTSPRSNLHISDSGQYKPNLMIEGTYNGSASDANLYIKRTKNNAVLSNWDTIGYVRFTSINSTPTQTDYARINGQVGSSTAGSERGSLNFEVMDNGSIITFLRFNGYDTVVNDNKNNIDFYVRGQVDSNLLFADASLNSIGVGTGSPLSLLHVSGGNIGGRALAIFDQRGATANDILTASASGATKLTLGNAGDLTVTGNVAAGTGKAFYVGSTQGQTYGSAVCVTTTGGIVTGTAACPGGTGGSNWTLENGTLHPNNATLDVLIGGTSTTSAKFAFMNVNSGTPVASVSAGVTGATYITADGTISTTNKMDLTLGGGTDAGKQVILTANSTTVKVGVGAGTVQVNNRIAVGSGGSLTQAAYGFGTSGNSAGTGLYAPADGQLGILSSKLERIRIDGSGLVGIGTTSPLSLFHVSGGNKGGNALAIFDQTGANTNDILTASASGTTKMTLNNGGDLTLSGNVSIATGKTYSISGSTSQTYASAVCVTTTGGIVTGTGVCTGGSTTDYWTLANGTLYPVNTTLDVLIGGMSTASARFGFLNVNSGTPIASVSANSGNNAVYLTGDGTLATTNRGTLTLGNSSTYNTTGNLLINPNGTGNVTIGGTSPYTTDTGLLSVYGGIRSSSTGNASLVLDAGTGGAAGNQVSYIDFRNSATLKGNIAVNEATSGTPLELNSAVSNDVTMVTGGGNVGIGNTSPSNLLHVTGKIRSENIALYPVVNNPVVYFNSQYITSADKYLTTNSAFQIWQDISNSILRFRAAPSGTAGTTVSFNEGIILNTVGNVGIGATSPLTTFHVSGGNRGGRALAIFDQTGAAANDILTASASGATKFKISNGGSMVSVAGANWQPLSDSTTALNIANAAGTPFVAFDTTNLRVGIGTTAPLTALDIVGSASLSANFSFRGAGIGHIFNILDNGNLDFRVSPGGDPSSANSALFIANNGNIGIGTTNPTAKLEIAGTTSTISNSSGNLTISSVSNLILSPTGNAGIGTTLPGLKLDVQDSQAATSAAQIFNTNTGVDADGLIVKLGNNSTSVVNSTNHFISFETSGIGIIGSIQGNGGKGLTYATNGVADFAEYLPKDENEDIPFGSIVCLGTDGKVHPCQGGTFTVAGVTSGNPAFLGGKNQGNASIPVALVGQVIVFVSNKNGAINAGDKITISDIPGVGVKATKSGATVGRALEPFNGTLGKIMVLVNISESTGLAYEQMDNLFMFKMAENGKTLFVDSKGNEVVSFDENGNATFKGSIEANKISANQIEGLTVLTNELITDKISKVAGASTSDQASTSSQSAVLSKLLNRDNNISILADLIVDQNATVNLNMNVLGKLAVEKGIIVSGPAKFKDETIFEKLVTFISKVVFKDDVKFDGTATFNKDTAGTAIVRKGADTVEIIFEKEFKNTPIITASVILDKENDQEKQKQTEQVTLGSDAKYVLANRNSKGFTIKLNNPTKIDMQFSWTAFSIDNPTTFESKPVVTPTVIPIISITPETQIASPSATN